MKNQALFSSKDKSKKLKSRLLQFLFGALKVGSISFECTVKPVLRGHPREARNWLLKTGDPLIQAHLHCIWLQGNQKMWLLNAGDPLIEVTT